MSGYFCLLLHTYLVRRPATCLTLLLPQRRCSQAGDPNNEKHCVDFLDFFDHHGPHGRHVCMVFEVLGDNLLALIKRFNYRGVPMPVIRHLTRQMLTGLDYLHRERRVRWRGYSGAASVYPSRI